MAPMPASSSYDVVEGNEVDATYAQALARAPAA
jgi:hypothetical protein